MTFATIPKLLLPLFLVSLPILAGTEKNEEILLQRKSHGMCLMDDKESAIYVNPPVPEEPKIQQFILEDADWTVKTSVDSSQGPVTDKRWEDFGTKYEKRLQLLSGTSTAFSIFADKDIEMTFYLFQGDDVADRFAISLIENKQWINFNLLTKSETARTFKGDKLEHISPLKLNEAFVINNKYVYWKKHEYKWSYSESPGSYKYPVPPELKSCLMLYVFMCSKCFLNVQNDTIEPINSTENYMNLWQHKKIEINSDEVKEIILYKGINDDSVSGYWGIDIRSCPKVACNKTILELTLPENEINLPRECNTLNNSNLNNNGATQRNAEEQLYTTCNPGLFGENCNVNCSEVVAMKYCQEHKFCEKGQCACAWGYTGPSCETSCEDGTWGMNCLGKCPSNCENSCDKLEGKCYKKDCRPSFAMHARALLIIIIQNMVRIIWIVLKNKNKEPLIIVTK